MKFVAATLVAFNAISVGAFAPTGNPLTFKTSSRVGTSQPLNAILKDALGKIKDSAVDKVLNVDLSGFSRETRLILNEITCTVTQAVATQNPEFILMDKENQAVGTNLGIKTENVTHGWTKEGSEWVKTPVETRTVDISDKWSVTILEEDDLSVNELKPMDYVMRKVLCNGFLNPIEDCDMVLASEAQAKRFMGELKLVQGEAIPDTYLTDFNMQTDESFSRIFFHGIGATMMMEQDEVTDPEFSKYGPFMVDLSFAAGLKIRDERFKCLGARVHFNAEQMVTAIYDCDEKKLFQPGEEGWEEAKMQAKVVTYTVNTAREHLSHTHLQVSNTASREVVMQLHPEHPIRRLLSIFLYNAVSVNQNALETLTPECGFVHRGVNLDYEDGFRPIFDNALLTSNAFEPFNKRKVKNPEVEKLATGQEGGLSKFPYLTEGREYYEIACDLVREWLKEAGDEAGDEYALDFYEAMKISTKDMKYKLPEYSPENLVDVIATVIFTVTAYHEIIGYVADYTDLPNKAGFRIVKDPKADRTQNDVQSALLSAMIGAYTAIPGPTLMDEFPNYIAAGGAPAWEEPVWTRFIAKMGLQAKKVQANDRERDFEFKHFDPTLFECSVSV